MIYFLYDNNHRNLDPISKVTKLDKNGIGWEVLMLRKGIVIRFMGQDYAKQKHFDITMNQNEGVLIHNTGVIFLRLQPEGIMKMYLEIQDFISDYYTDDIWEMIQDMLQALISRKM